MNHIENQKYLIQITKREFKKRTGSIFEFETWWQYELTDSTGSNYQARCFICDQVFEPEYWNERGYEHGDIHLKNIAAFL
jgi:hypothetical protein